MQVMNDLGLFMFTKYYIRIQRVIANAVKENPSRALSMVLFQNYFDGLQTILDSSMIGRLGNPLHLGALGLPGVADEIATIKAMATLIK